MRVVCGPCAAARVALFLQLQLQLLTSGCPSVSCRRLKLWGLGQISLTALVGRGRSRRRCLCLSCCHKFSACLATANSGDEWFYLACCRDGSKPGTSKQKRRSKNRNATYRQCRRIQIPGKSCISGGEIHAGVAIPVPNLEVRQGVWCSEELLSKLGEEGVVWQLRIHCVTSRRPVWHFIPKTKRSREIQSL